jgi:hypothetical protein
VQQDGSVLVTEEHTLSNGWVILVPYQAASADDIQPILEARALRIEARAQQLQRIRDEENNFEMPISRREFRKRFTQVEQEKIAMIYATYTTNTNLTNTQKERIAFSREYLNESDAILLSDPVVIAIVNRYEQFGLIATGRAAQILGIE